jgi:hypothetical protein
MTSCNGLLDRGTSAPHLWVINLTDIHNVAKPQDHAAITVDRRCFFIACHYDMVDVLQRSDCVIGGHNYDNAFFHRELRIVGNEANYTTLSWGDKSGSTLRYLVFQVGASSNDS